MSYTFRNFYIPERMMPALKNYTEHGEIPGDFLQAVISNDLSGAVGRADEENLANLPAFVAYLYNEVPAGAWGSREKMYKWRSRCKS